MPAKMVDSSVPLTEGRLLRRVETGPVRLFAKWAERSQRQRARKFWEQRTRMVTKAGALEVCEPRYLLEVEPHATRASGLQSAGNMCW